MTAKERRDAYFYDAGKAMGKLKEITMKLPWKGDKCETSQKVCIGLAIKELECAILSLEIEDME